MKTSVVSPLILSAALLAPIGSVANADLAAPVSAPVAPAAAIDMPAAAVAKAPTPSKATASKITELHLRALRLLDRNDVKGAIRILRDALAAENANAKDLDSSRDELDRARLTLGRLLYESGEFEQAIVTYDSVRKYGPSWLEALEERAWSSLRSEHPQEAIASLKTVTSPLYKDSVRAEPYFVLALAELRICDFPALFKTFEQFKERFRDRLKSWEHSPLVADRTRLREAADTIQKLNLVEAEAIQRLYLDTDLKKNVDVPRVTKAAGQLSFPAIEGDEVWLDEVDKFRVSIRGCPAIGAAEPPARRVSSNGKRETAK